VQQSGGEIWVESEVELGTAVHVLLPEAGPPGEGAPATEVPATPARGRETIMLVEDEAGVRSLTRRVLERFGYTVLDAPSGTEALAMATAFDGRIHLVVTDVVMPGMTGPEVGEAFVARFPGVRVLLISGYAESVLGRNRDTPQSLPLLPKPFTPDQLGRKVREILDA
jgi:CheY-like chemotaxis protein